MAINPNTDFVSGDVLTAAQQNRFPRGVMSYTSSTSSDTTITTEETQFTATAFTAVANRYYRITYHEPDLYAGTGYFTSKIKNGATTLQTGYNTSGASVDRSLTTVWVGTFSAGSITITATLSMSAGTGQAVRSATVVGFVLIEDIGPA